MRLQIVFPPIEPSRVALPAHCPMPGCGGEQFRLHQEVWKSLRDRHYDAVPTYRYQCLRCGHTFRVYPRGVGRGQVSHRVRGLGLLLYLLGLSYRQVSELLNQWGIYFCKSRLHDAVREAGNEIIGLQRKRIFDRMRPAGPGEERPSVRWEGKWFPLELLVHDIDGLVLTMTELSITEVERLRNVIAPMAMAAEANVFVVDDVDVFRAVA